MIALRKIRSDLSDKDKRIKELEDQVEQLKALLREVQGSVQRAQSLMGIKVDPSQKTDDFLLTKNSASELESQLMNFITKSAAEQSSSSIDLEKKINDQEDQIAQLKSQCQALIFEKNAVMSVLGIRDEKESSDEESNPLLMPTDSQVFNQVQTMNLTIEDQLKQIELLKKHLITAAQTLQQLSGERNSIMQALMPGAPTSGDPQTDRSMKNLFRNLESLGIQISKQNEDINSVIGDNSSLDAESTPIQKPARRERPQRPQNFVVAALKQIRSQLESAQQEASEKEIKIAELENEIERLQKSK